MKQIYVQLLSCFLFYNKLHDKYYILDVIFNSVINIK